MKKAIDYLKHELKSQQMWYEGRGRVSIKDMIEHDNIVKHYEWAIKELSKEQEKNNGRNE